MNDNQNAFRGIAIGFAAVTEAVGCSLAGFAVGYFLDKWIEKTKPWLTVAGSLFGLSLGFYLLYKIYIRESGGDGSGELK